ncbi:MAG: AbrB/MazE/SpoVT family DNA-binding domain-containing protein [Firmicutes bacterium]|nr:AbrB/MazE/SpoVT family DNA-binding domain-containing protein [Bacillota bacterium]
MAKDQITLPKDIRSKLRLSTGDRVALICEEDRVIHMNDQSVKLSTWLKSLRTPSA